MVKTIQNKCITNLTVMAETINVQNYISVISKELGYKPLKYTYGIHKEATRYHIHLMTIWDISGTVKYKTLNKKIQSILNSYTDLQKPDRITFGYSERITPTEKEYAESCMMYPFKEFKSFDEIVLDNQFGYTETELEDMRREAHEIWLKSQKMKAYEKNRIEKDKTKQETFYKHLDTITIHSFDNVENKIADIAEAILDYKFQNQEKFRIHDVKNQAVNYLYLRKKITNHDVLNICGIYR